jgi:hypothetical protein
MTIRALIDIEFLGRARLAVTYKWNRDEAREVAPIK